MHLQHWLTGMILRAVPFPVNQILRGHWDVLGTSMAQTQCSLCPAGRDLGEQVLTWTTGAILRERGSCRQNGGPTPLCTGPGNGGPAQKEGRTEWTCSQDKQTHSPAAMSSVCLCRVYKQPLIFSDALEEINVYAAIIGGSPQGKTPGQLPEKLGGHRDDSGQQCGRADTAVRGKWSIE